MLNLNIYLFGATYITRDKFAPMAGSTHRKPFGMGSSPYSEEKCKSFLKFDCTCRVDHPLTAPKYRDKPTINR